MKISHDKYVDIIEAYTIDLWSMREIAATLHVSHATIYKILVKEGIDTSRRKLHVSCTVCGQPIERTKKRVRKQRNHFCNRECYEAYLGAGARDGCGSRQAQKIGRSVVLQWFALQPEHVVHHENHKQFDNRPVNLRVFANQGDHIRYHHNQRHEHFNPITSPRLESWERFNHLPVNILWDGRNL